MVWLLALALAIGLAASSISGTALAAPGEPSPTADKVADFYDAIFWTVVAVLAVTEALLIWAGVRPRPPAPDEPSPVLNELVTSRTEIAWTLAPAVLLAFVAVLAYRAFH